MLNQVMVHIYLQSKVVCFVCHAEISQTMVLHVALLVSLESSKWLKVHKLVLRLLEAMVL
jgi:hypothetical protein